MGVLECRVESAWSETRDMCMDGFENPGGELIEDCGHASRRKTGITIGSYNGAGQTSPGQVYTVRHTGLILGIKIPLSHHCNSCL